MTYEESVSYIEELPKFTTKNPLVHTKLFVERLGNLLEGRKVIHVAGTNGKGSVCAYLDALLRAGDKTVGLFTSPHLVTHNERIVINGVCVSDEVFLEVFDKTMSVVTDMQRDGIAHPTYFEFLFGMAIVAFARAEAEYIILETGLGGRLDATNAVEHPAVSVICSIGMDHVNILGHTLSEIAAEKAGIIKKDVPVFYAEGKEESNRVIEARAKELGVPCRKISKSAYEIMGIENKHIAFSCTSAYYEGTTWELNNIAGYQAHNAMLALEVMRFLCGEKKRLFLWKDALLGVKWPGRMEEVLPNVYVDGAHNIDAVCAFIRWMPKNPAGNIILFSAVADKEYEEMIACLCRQSDTELYVVTTIEDKRAVQARVLGRTFEKYTDKEVIMKETLDDAFRYVLSVQGGRTIYCLGSLYLAGMIAKWI